MTNPDNMPRVGRPRKFNYEAIARDYETGMTWADIIAKHNCYPVTISKAMKENGICANRSITDEMVDKMVLMYTQKNKTLQAIGDVFGTNASVVRRHLVNRGVQTRSRGFRSGKKIAKFIYILTPKGEKAAKEIQ